MKAEPRRLSHLDVDVIDFLLLAAYPAGALFLIEMISRGVRIPTWIKLSVQGVASAGFAIAYVTLITAHWFTSLVLAFLAVALFYQARRARVDPGRVPY